MWRRKYFILLILAGFLMKSFSIKAQVDTTRKKLSIDSIILRQKGIIGKLVQNLLTDTATGDMTGLQRTDEPFNKYKDRIIRNINIQVTEFEITDTAKRFNNKLKRVSDKLHRRTRDFVIRNNLFFSRNEKLAPYVLGDNERHLRDLPFTRDAKITVLPVPGSEDSVDVYIITHDVLSLGGSFRMHNTESVSLSVREDNFLGYGDRIRAQGLFDITRKEKFGYGFDFIKRNIGGSFVDGAIGFSNFDKTFSNGRREERISYFRLTRPLVNRYMKWTYGSQIEMHETQNFYNPDSLYDFDFKYKYKLVDAWGAWNIDADRVDGNTEKARSRRLIGLRVIEQKFSDKPLKYANQYFYSYADLSAVLASVSVFRQNFYKTQYIYGFGRNEDVPEGMEFSLTGGWTKKNQRKRPFVGLDFQRYYFTVSQHYFNYTVRAGAFLYNGKAEDIDLLAQVDYFSRLHHLERKWKQRFFFSASATRQVNSLLNEPLRLESEYGLEELKNNFAGGNSRVTVKAESVFFSPWSVLFFRFAPFIFGNGTYLNLRVENASVPKFYGAVGGGVRIRNESLIFGTTEFRGMYFPRKNFRNESWRIEVNTNIRFKYNREFIKRPEFVRVN
jgi:hypothetical protein